MRGEVYVAPPPPPQASARTSPAGKTGHSAAGGGAKRTQKGAKGRMVAKVRTLGDALCERLRAEPVAVFEVLNEILERQLEVTSSMLEELCRACGARGGPGLDGALQVLRDLTAHEMVRPEQRELAMIFLVKWCKEDGESFAKIQNEMRETERTEHARENLNYANRLYTQLAEGCSW